MELSHEQLDIDQVSIRYVTKLGQRNHEVRKNPGRYDNLDYDYDFDNDNDNDDDGAKGRR